MAETLGVNIRGGWQREAIVTAQTWPATTAALVSSLWPVVDLRPTDGVSTRAVNTLSSGLGPLAADVLAIAPSVEVPLLPAYQGLEPLWACALGHMQKRISGVLMPEALGGGAYRHLYEMDPGLSTSSVWNESADGWIPADGLDPNQRKVRRGTFAVDLTISVWEWLSTMVQSLTPDVSETDVRLTVGLLGHSLSRTSTINTLTTLQGALPSVVPRMRPHEMVFRVASYSTGTPLGISDELRCTQWSLRLENALSGSPGPRTGLAPEEYERGAVPQVTLSFTPPRHTLDVWQTRWATGTILMADARWTSPQEITTGQPYRCNLLLPNCVVTSAPLGIAGAQLPTETVEVLGIVPSATPAGFPTLSRLAPLAVELVSGSNTHPLL